MQLSGKKAVVTGASQGLGLAIAEAFVREGADVLICARTPRDLTAAVESLSLKAARLGQVSGLQTDVSHEADVLKLAAEADARWGQIDVLVCNAGVYGPKGAIDRVDWSSWAEAIAVNLNGTVLCCRAFLPLLRLSSRGKIILLSGGGATKPLPFLSAYAASKAAVARFGETLAEELKQDGIDVNLVAPGALNTRLLDEILEAGPEAVGASFYEASVKQKQNGGTALDRGASLCVYLASNASSGISGKLISAVWDPWEHFDEHVEDLRDSDVYTLRRIIPSERGMGWG